MRRTLALVVLASHVVACSLLVSLDGLSGSGPQDEGGLSDDATNEASLGADASAEAGSDAETGTIQGPFCPLHLGATFCSDFDLSSKVDDGWSFRIQQGAPGVSVLDRASFVSPPQSLQLTVPSGVPGNGDGYVNRIGWSPGALVVGDAVHFECMMRVDSLDAFTRAFLVSLSLGPDYAVSLLASRSSALLQEATTLDGASPPAIDTPLSALVPLAVWTRLEIDVVFKPTASITVKFDGATAVSRTPAPGYSAGVSQADIGPRYYTSATVEATSVHYDNVLVEVR